MAFIKTEKINCFIHLVFLTHLAGNMKKLLTNSGGNMKTKYKPLAVVSIIGFIACIASFIIALINSKYVFSVAFLLAAIYCINHFALSLKK